MNVVDVPLQELIEEVKKVCTNESDFMNEKEFTDCDKFVHTSGILTYAEIIKVVKSEERIITRSHKKKVLDKEMDSNFLTLKEDSQETSENDDNMFEDLTLPILKTKKRRR
jgi:hypothetical protein